MPVIEKHPNGSFCWMELHTTDQNAAKQFYGSLFGWEANDNPMGPEMIYTTFRLKGRDCSAAFTLEKEQRERGVPPHWMLYIATDDVDAATKRVTELGGTVMAGPFDAATFGRMSVIKDPTGAHFCLWQAKQSPGIGIAGEEGAFCWADLLTRDRAAAKKFYQGLFGWNMSAGGKAESDYWHISNGVQMIGGLPPESVMQQPGITPHWEVYYQVADCEAATAKAQSLGAQVCLAPTKIEGAGVMSVVADPQGAAFSLFQSTMKLD